MTIYSLFCKSRISRRCGFAVLGALMLSMPASAETIPATYGPSGYYVAPWKSATLRPSIQEACEAGTAVLLASAADLVSVTVQSCTVRPGPAPSAPGAVADVAYLLKYFRYGWQTSYNTMGQYISSDTFTYACPDASWTLAGTTCTRPDCTAGQFRDATGVCLDNCPAGTTWSAPAGSCACPL